MRQFQQFQQFQEFLKFQQAQQEQGGSVVPSPQHPPAPHPGPQYPAPHYPEQQYPPQQPGAHGSVATTNPQELEPRPPRRRRKPPRWLVWLGKKVLAWLIAFLLLAIAATWAYNHFFGDSGAGQTTEEYAEHGGGTYRTNELLSDEPYEAVRQVYDAIAQTDPETGGPLVPQACGRFAERTQQTFAENLGHADCREAVRALHEEVTHVNDYAESIFTRGYLPTSEQERIDSCSFTISGGPALGVFVVEKQDHAGQWLITGHEPGPENCPAPPAPQPSN
nr:hypothetical protein [Saccharomonospora sp. CUA-673]